MMHSRHNGYGARAGMFACAALLLLGLAMAPGAAVGAPSERELKLRHVPEKPHATKLRDDEVGYDIVVKFHEGTRVRKRADKLVAQLEALSAKEQRRRDRLGLDDDGIEADVEEVNRLVAGPSGLALARQFSRPEEELDREQAEGEATAEEELADLNLYYRIALDVPDRKRVEKLVDRLNALAVVEIAYVDGVGEDAAVDIAPETPNYESQQGHLTAINEPYARGVWSAGGLGIRVIDIEQGWRLDHEDLNPVFYQSGTLATTGSNVQHGTAVLGVIAATQILVPPNPWGIPETGLYGMRGIAPRASLGVVSPTVSGTYNFADAMNRAANKALSGDIVLIEQHQKGPASGLTCICNCSQFEYIPMEYWSANFDAIRTATARGVIVVEAAGNGSMNLSASVYQNRFNRSTRDSGAILVGAGTSSGRSPTCWTNYGTRVDVQGWGENVRTLGYGDYAMVNGTDQRQWYTDSFSGTSSASPIVTGAAAFIQSYRKMKYLPVLTPPQMQRLLRETGGTQASSTKQIGPLPNLSPVLSAHGVGCRALGAGPAVGVTGNYSGTDDYVVPDGWRDFCLCPPKGSTYTISTCKSYGVDTILQVMWGSSVLKSNDDSASCGAGSTRSHLVIAPPSVAECYKVRVRGKAPANQGKITLTVRRDV